MTALTFVEFDARELARWLERTVEDYAQDRAGSGMDHLEQARETARRTIEQMFPEGTPAPGHQAGHVLSDGEVVGELWIGPHTPGSSDWWVWNVEIVPERRGQGLGRRAMQLAEEMAAAKAADSIGLNVFGQNTVARNLYESMGYETTAVLMRKPL